MSESSMWTDSYGPESNSTAFTAVNIVDLLKSDSRTASAAMKQPKTEVQNNPQDTARETDAPSRPSATEIAVRSSLEDLTSGDRSVRDAAIRNLRNTGRDGVDILLRLSADPQQDEDLRHNCNRFLSNDLTAQQLTAMVDRQTLAASTEIQNAARRVLSGMSSDQIFRGLGQGGVQPTSEQLHVLRQLVLRTSSIQESLSAARSLDYELALIPLSRPQTEAERQMTQTQAGIRQLFNHAGLENAPGTQLQRNFEFIGDGNTSIQVRDRINSLNRRLLDGSSEQRMDAMVEMQQYLPRIVASLDSPSYAVRDNAMNQIMRLGSGAIPALFSASDQPGSVERNRRLEQALSRLLANSDGCVFRDSENNIRLRRLNDWGYRYSYSYDNRGQLQSATVHGGTLDRMSDGTFRRSGYGGGFTDVRDTDKGLRFSVNGLDVEWGNRDHGLTYYGTNISANRALDGIESNR